MVSKKRKSISTNIVSKGFDKVDYIKMTHELSEKVIEKNIKSWANILKMYDSRKWIRICIYLGGTLYYFNIFTYHYWEFKHKWQTIYRKRELMLKTKNIIKVETEGTKKSSTW